MSSVGRTITIKTQIGGKGCICTLSNTSVSKRAKSERAKNERL